MLRYKTETRPGLVALYDIRPGNGVGQFLQPRSPHRALGWGNIWNPGSNYQILSISLISLTWQVSTRVGGVEIQSLVQYWIKTVCYRSKDHFRWTACTPLYPAGPKSGGHCPPHPTPMLAKLKTRQRMSISPLTCYYRQCPSESQLTRRLNSVTQQTQES